MEVYPGAAMFSSLEELLDSGVEAVAIATPAESHFRLAKQVLDSGRPCFVEKPVTLSSRDAEDLCESAERQGVALMVGHLLIYQPAVAFLKQAIHEGLIGEVKIFNHERLNLGRARDVENVLWSLGVHDLAVSLYLSNSAPVDCGMTGVCALQEGIEDDTRVWMTLADGSIAHIHNSWLWPELRRKLTLIGTHGMLVYDEVAQSVTFHRKSIDLPGLENRDEGSEVVFEGAGKPLTLEMEHFLQCIQSGETPLTSGRSALEVVRVMERISPFKVKV